MRRKKSAGRIDGDNGRRCRCERYLRPDDFRFIWSKPYPAESIAELVRAFAELIPDRRN
jgi:hypothetical protein